jgi:hypothetical protein
MRRFLSMMALALAALLAAPALAQQDQPEQSAPAKKPVHVLTEDDLSKPATASDAAATSSDQDQDKDKDQDQDKDKDAAAAKDPADKRTDVQKAEDEAKKWKNEEDMLNRKLERVQQQEADEQSDFRKQMLQDAYNNQQATLQDIRAKRDAAEKQLAAAKEKQQEQGGAENPQGAQPAPQEQPPQEQPPQ